ncbi:MAG: hypothetical protein AB1540_11950 [Bdellovibrionota bacterium]
MGSLKNNSIQWVLLALLTATPAVAHAKCKYSTLSAAQCEKIKRVTEKWPPKTEIARVDEVDPETGACRYNADENKVEVAAAALEKYSENALAQCLARAFANANYADVEEQWAKELGEHKAWIVRRGEAQEVSTEGKKLAAVSAHALWTTFAARELLARYEGLVNDGGQDVATTSGRTLASLNDSASAGAIVDAEATPGGGGTGKPELDEVVRGLLGASTR